MSIGHHYLPIEIALPGTINSLHGRQIKEAFNRKSLNASGGVQFYTVDAPGASTFTIEHAPTSGSSRSQFNMTAGPNSYVSARLSEFTFEKRKETQQEFRYRVLYFDLWRTPDITSVEAFFGFIFGPLGGSPLTVIPGATIPHLGVVYSAASGFYQSSQADGTTLNRVDSTIALSSSSDLSSMIDWYAGSPGTGTADHKIGGNSPVTKTGFGALDVATWHAFVRATTATPRALHALYWNVEFQ